MAPTGASTAWDKSLPEGRRSEAEALGLAHQIVKPACHLLSATAPAMGSKSASISHEEVGPGQRFRPHIIFERGAVALRAVPLLGAQRCVNCVPEEPKIFACETCTIAAMMLRMVIWQAIMVVAWRAALNGSHS